ncbi:MAG TPA: glutamate synthase large subunit, partial [Deltaproteobacteria bacterium]|nr:glutamate synthase large subunit [Deltaproteobacteria bacterium]
VVTKDDLVIMASEVGAVDIAPEQIVSKGRLQPGKMFLVDTQLGRIISDEELKNEICAAQPYENWLKDNVITLDALPTPRNLPKTNQKSLLERQKIFGYTTEDLNVLLTPMIRDGEEATGSMGNDAPLAALSDRPQLMYGYFKQIFAQVSNPPVDSIREEMVMSMTSHLGGEGNILNPLPEHAKLIKIDHPVLTNTQFAKLRYHDKAGLISLLFPASDGSSGLQKALDRICAESSSSIRSGKEYLILSDRGVCRDKVPIPALLAVGAVHHHLIREKLRSSSSLILETGEAREIAHFCLLVGYGVGAINPYLAFETFEQMLAEGTFAKELTYENAVKNYLKSIRKGMFKVFAKMGISSIQSYRGAQIFEAIGLSEEVIHEYFSGTPSKISGVTVEVLGEECLKRHALAYIETPDLKNTLSVGGQYFWRRRGEYHQVNPTTTMLLQEATQKNSKEVFKKFSTVIDEQSQRLATPRSLLTFKQATPIPLEEVEAAREIVKRFATGAMSLGSISTEAHQTLAVAMNRIGGRSNSGEGGEDPQRFQKKENGDWPMSRIKQVASGRFGVTIHYLVNCVELQIKVAQGAKPGEGGQLPGKKVSQEIAEVRHSTPGVTLISPPPHHDIYSIEDLAQLIFDLKNANPKARITVKLVSEAGVGTIAAGVAKTHADLIVIAGHDGGTGASPLTSIKYAGVPWELGLSEAHQTLLLNRLRGRVRLQTDGQLKTGRDVVIAAMLGAEEFGFSTAPLIAIGCIMMRKCHLNTCPVGIATQDPELRKKFVGQPEHVINFFFMVAEEVREIMAKCGFRSVSEMVGRSDYLEQRSDITHWKAKHVDLSNLLRQIPIGEGDTRYCTQEQDHGLDRQIDHELIARAKEAILESKPVKIEMIVKNIDRSIGTMLSGEIAIAHGARGLPDHTIHCQLKGSAGQSFGAFLAPGVTLELEGDANDYTGKGLSGGKLIVYPPRKSTFKADENILIGNTVLYGATNGEAFFSGIAGERFAVRNSGAMAIVEGVGDHGCEYMTGGRVIVLGQTGRNFAAGMSGGIAYVFDEKNHFTQHCNHGMVELSQLSQLEEVKWVREMIQQHLKYTQSLRASKLLENWDHAQKKFVRVMPTEYRLVLEKMNTQAA